MILPVLLMQAIPSLAPQSPPQDAFAVYYKGGLRFEAADRSFMAKMGGRIQWDAAYVGNNKTLEKAVGPLEDGTEFRRARLYVSGSVSDGEVEWKAQYDFAGGAAAFKDVYLAFPGLPFGKLTVGQFKEPFSLEEQTSSNNITFLERALPLAFSPERSTGVMVGDHVAGDRMTWAAGVFRDSNAQGMQRSDGELDVTGRVTGLAWSEDGGADLLHLGASVSLSSPDGDAVRYRSRPESHIAPYFADTGVMAADGATLVGLEAAWVSGPASLQGEFMQSQTDFVGGGDATFSGYYLEGSWFLSDDRRPYDAKYGAFGAVSPSGDDAWQAKLRFSSLDLSDGPIAGGEQTDVTVGLNWYLNDNARIMFELVNADLDAVASTLIAQIRCQVTW